MARNHPSGEVRATGGARIQAVCFHIHGQHFSGDYVLAMNWTSRKSLFAGFQALERVKMHDLDAFTKWRHLHFGWFVSLRADAFKGMEGIIFPLQGNAYSHEHKLVHI